MDNPGLLKADALAQGVRVTVYDDALAVLTTSSFRQIAHAEPAPSAVLLGGTMITLHGREHLERRRLENPLFEPLALRRYESVALVALTGQLAAIEETADPGSDYVRADLVSFIPTVVIAAGAAVIGLDLDRPGLAERLAHYSKAFEDAVQDSDYKTVDLDDAFWRGFDRAEIDAFRCDLVDPSRERRRELVGAHRAGRCEIDDLPVDLLTLLALHAAEWDDQDVLREVVLYIIGATGTSSQSVFESVVELLRWLDRHPEDRERLADVAFVRAACNEAIRLHPPPPALIRLADRDAELPSGLQVTAGEIVYVDLPAANHDAAWFSPGPDEYDPHRSLIDKARPFGVGFGAGTHMCIGQRFATGRSGGEVAQTDAIGVVAQIVLTLVRAGIALDPDRPQRLKRGTLRRIHLELPVRFARAALVSYLGEMASA
jgi:cytochrome P450